MRVIEEKSKKKKQIKALFRSPTFYILLLCSILFVWTSIEAYRIEKKSGELSLSVGLTPVLRTLFFDYPSSLQDLDDLILKYDLRSIGDLKKLSPSIQRQFQQLDAIPVWNGLVGESLFWIRTGSIEDPSPLFEKIQKGQIWRLFSPCLIHRDYMHFLFNMGWVLILGLQIEIRLKKMRMLLLIVTVGIFSNVAQYLMGGPFFLGFSGVITGLVAFIWARQKKSPDEGYPLPRSASLFLFYFVLGMVCLEGLTFALQAFAVAYFSFPIANTAHLAGGLAGVALGKCSFFARRA